jgi:acylphosphatase
MTANRMAVIVRIDGRVQGVGYRAWVDRTARGLGLSGWVRNRFDGTVEACFVGNREDVENQISQCWQGPRSAVVTQVEVSDAPGDTESGGGFLIRETV